MLNGFLKQSTASQSRLVGPFIDDTDFKTLETGLTISNTDVKLSKNGAASVNKNSGGGTHRVNGKYSLTFDATDTNTVGELDYSIAESGALIVTGKFVVLEEAIYDGLFASGAARVPADATAISGDVTAADNLETLFDGNEGFYPAYAGPRGPGVYVNDAAANTTTVNGVDGTIGDPVSTIAAAKTLADSMSLDRIYLVNDSAITLAATMTGYEFVGIGDLAANSVNLGNQIITNSSFINVLLTGQQNSTSGRMSVFGGALLTVTGLNAYVYQAAITGNTTLDASADSFFDACWSAVAGNSTPQLTFAASSNLSWRHYSGGLQINSMAATNTMSYETDGQMIIGASCTGGALTIRGNCTLTDNASGAVTVTDDARMDIERFSISKNTALANFEIMMTDSTNHNPSTGLTVTATRSIDGAAFGACANAVTEVANGIYKIDLAATDLNGDVITLRFTAAASDDTVITIVTQDA